MKPFTESNACRSRAHCPTCRTDPKWRENTGAPEVCPFGVTQESLPKPPPPGAGSHLTRMLKEFGIAASPGCQCLKTAAAMDRNGPDWCEENIEGIVQIMTEEAEKRKWMRIVPFREKGARWLVRQAIAAARNSAHEQSQL